MAKKEQTQWHNCIIGRSLSHNVTSGTFSNCISIYVHVYFFFYLFTLLFFYIYIMCHSLVFQCDSWICESMGLSFLCLPLGSLLSLLLSYSNVLADIFFSLYIFYYFLTEACFLMRDEGDRSG